VVQPATILRSSRRRRCKPVICFVQKRREVRRAMRKRITILVATVVMALTMAFGSMAAFAAFTNVCSNEKRARAFRPRLSFCSLTYTQPHQKMRDEELSKHLVVSYASRVGPWPHMLATQKHFVTT
jgi:hypothetical protein